MDHNCGDHDGSTIMLERLCDLTGWIVIRVRLSKRMGDDSKGDDRLVTESRKVEVEVYRVQKTSMILKHLNDKKCMKKSKSCLYDFFLFQNYLAPPENTRISALPTACHLVLLDACCAVTPQSSAGALALARTADIVVVSPA